MSELDTDYILTEEEIQEGNVLLSLFYAAHFEGELEVVKSDFRKGHEPLNHLESWESLMEIFEMFTQVWDERRSGKMEMKIGGRYVYVDHPYERVWFSGNEFGHDKEPIRQKVWRGLVEGIKYLHKEKIKYGV